MLRPHHEWPESPRIVLASFGPPVVRGGCQHIDGTARGRHQLYKEPELTPHHNQVNAPNHLGFSSAAPPPTQDGPNHLGLWTPHHNQTVAANQVGRRRRRHFADIPSPSLLEHLLTGEGGAAE